MKLENQELLKEFYDRNKDKYPDLSFEQMKECCTSQYVYAKKEIESGDLPVIRLKYFGTFMVYPKRADSILRRMNEQFKLLKINAKFYFEKKAMLEKFLNNEEQKKNK